MGQNIGIASGLAFVGAKFGFHSKSVKKCGFLYIILPYKSKIVGDKGISSIF